MPWSRWAKTPLQEFISMSADGTCEGYACATAILLNENALKTPCRSHQNRWVSTTIFILVGAIQKYIARSLFEGLQPSTCFRARTTKTTWQFWFKFAGKTKPSERYGNKIPMEEKWFSPGDTHDWKGLYRVNWALITQCAPGHARFSHRSRKRSDSGVLGEAAAAAKPVVFRPGRPKTKNKKCF